MSTLNSLRLNLSTNGFDVLNAEATAMIKGGCGRNRSYSRKSNRCSGKSGRSGRSRCNRFSTRPRRNNCGGGGNSTPPVTLPPVTSN